MTGVWNGGDDGIWEQVCQFIAVPIRNVVRVGTADEQSGAGELSLSLDGFVELGVIMVDYG